MLRDAQISEIIRMSIVDELIEDDVRVIRDEVGIESVVEVLIDGMIGIYWKRRRWLWTNGHRLNTRPIFMEVNTKIGGGGLNLICNSQGLVF